MNTGKQKLIVLTGPTAVGKTALSIALAKKLQAEIISADSMQVYRRMDIGTAKIRAEETEGIPHHLIDVLEPTEPFNVYRFQQMAKEAMAGIVKRGHLPLIVGGTGFYIQSVLYDIDFDDTSDEAYREELEERIQTGGEEAAAKLYEELKRTDPDAADAIHPHNVKRVIRALCFQRETGGLISAHNETMRAKESPYDFRYFVLTDDRQAIYDRTDLRVDKMMEAGLLEEVRSLKEEGVPADATAMQGLAYRELYRYFDGAYDLEEAIRLIKRNTRHFAKRQLTWFHREREVIWVDRRDYPEGEEQMLGFMLEKITDEG